MDDRKMQQFLTLMDSVHDYGNTARVQKVLSKQETNNDAIDEDHNADNASNLKSFNPAFLIDFLLLGYIHPYFKAILGLNVNQHYISKKANCSNNVKKYTFQDAFSKQICEKFYYPTYGERIVFRSVKPEDISRNVLYEYLKEYRNIDYQTHIEVRFPDISNRCALSIKLGNKFKKTGIYENNNITTQGKVFNSYIKKLFIKSKLCFVTDANKLPKEWFCVENESLYMGKFIDYDSYKQNYAHLSGGGEYDDTNSDTNNSNIIKCIKSEFQNYSLTKADNELIFFEAIRIYKDDVLNEYIILHKINGFEEKALNTKIQNSNDPRGLSLFLLLFNEINKKTLGFKMLSKKSPILEKLKKQIETVGIKALKDTYKITLTIDDEASDDYIKLKPEQFVLALFDLKRAMDYLYVKACATANQNAKANEKYVFVSSDRSAICYSLMLNNPCILTLPVSSKGTDAGEQKIVLYNPIEPIKQNIKKDNYNSVKSNTFEQYHVDIDDNDIEIDDNEIVGIHTLREIAGLNIKDVNAEEDPNKILKELCEEFLLNLSNGKKRTRNPYDPSTSMNIGKSDTPRVQNMKKACQEILNKVGGDKKHTIKDILKTEIPLNNLDDVCEYGSPMYIFFHFYSQLDSSINFFWFVVFKSLLYFVFGDEMVQSQFADTEPRPTISPSLSMDEKILQETKPWQSTITRRAISNNGQRNNSMRKIINT